MEKMNIQSFVWSISKIILVIVSYSYILLIYSCSSESFTDKNFDINGVKFKMIAIEGGSFMMGATPEQGDSVRANEKPVHKVTVDDFYIGETEVTQELWSALMENNPSHFKSDQGNLPVETVFWFEVHDFIKKLNDKTGLIFRLPFEAEWEYAARGGQKSTNKKYAGSDNIDEVAWYVNNSEETTHPVASKKANELGLYDMTGNVLEWCLDWYGNYSIDEQNNPHGAMTGDAHIERGGCWAIDENRMTNSYRDCDKAEYRNYTTGFRLVLVL